MKIKPTLETCLSNRCLYSFQTYLNPMDSNVFKITREPNNKKQDTGEDKISIYEFVLENNSLKVYSNP